MPVIQEVKAAGLVTKGGVAKLSVVGIGMRSHSGVAARLFDCATIHGASSISAPGGTLDVGRAADFFTIDLNDPSIAGANDRDLLPAIVFALARTAIREVVVGGRLIAQAGQHQAQRQIIERFARLQRTLWP